MSDFLAVLGIFAIIINALVVLLVFVSAWVDYGIDDKNLLRVTLKSLRGFVWPIWLAIFLVGYAKTRFRKDAEEMFPSRREARLIAEDYHPSWDTARPTVTAEKEPRHEPYEWMN